VNFFILFFCQCNQCEASGIFVDQVQMLYKRMLSRGITSCTYRLVPCGKDSRGSPFILTLGLARGVSVHNWTVIQSVLCESHFSGSLTPSPVPISH
jgi:hypothetical protein